MKKMKHLFLLSLLVILTGACTHQPSRQIASSTNNHHGGVDVGNRPESRKITLYPSQISNIIKVVEKTDDGVEKKVQFVVIDRGLSTDVAPRYAVYLGYSSYAEMGNLFFDQLINDQVMKVISATRKTAGIYELKVVEFRQDKFFEVVQEIDTTTMFAAENKMRSNENGFIDGPISAKISVKELSAKPQ